MTTSNCRSEGTMTMSGPLGVDIDFGHATITLLWQAKERQRKHYQASVTYEVIIITKFYQASPLWGMLNDITTVVTLTPLIILPISWVGSIHRLVLDYPQLNNICSF